MAKRYLSSSAIDQKFTSGPLLGAPVKYSFSSATTNEFGPTVNFEQKFKSGSEEDIDTVNEINACSQFYYRVIEDPILCPPLGCAIPTLISATLSSSCDLSYNKKYIVTYNSGSSTARYTIIQYSTTPNFTSNVASSSYVNAKPFNAPVDISTLPGGTPINGYTPVYFRAYNSCSDSSTTSSFSNTLTAVCSTTPPSTYQPFYYELANKSTSSIRFTLDADNNFIVGTGNTFSITSSTQLSSLTLSVIGTPKFRPPTKILSGSENYPQYVIKGQSSVNYSSLISTEIYPLINSRYDQATAVTRNNYKITQDISGEQTRYSVTSSIWDLHSGVFDNDLTIPITTTFASDGIDANAEIRIDIDRHEWTSTGKLTFTVTPLAEQWYLYKPTFIATCVLSGTPITLANGTTTPIDNLRGGDRVLSPSILTLPSNNDFDLFNWAINELILTEGTALVTGNVSHQVNEVYLINNGTLTTTSTHQHLFKQNGTWNIKPTPYLMVGDYLSGRNGEEILIESIEILTGKFTVFNLDVEENDLYIANGILTHNVKIPIAK